MDIQDQGKTHSSGHESHGVHLCQKCGWPFPNPHPSAKHRRAHKKICGTIEGYKLVDSVGISHSTPSDEEPVSDKDQKSPIAQVPKVMDSSGLEKNIGGIGALSNRSEDEVFSDAAMEFQDSRFGGLGRLDSLDNAASKADKIAEKYVTPNVSFKDCEDTYIFQPARNSADRSEKENLVLTNMSILSMGTPEHQDHGLSCPQDRNGSTSDVIPSKTEPLMDILEESRKVSGGGKVAECSVGQETAKENEVGNLNKSLSGGLILPNEHAGENSETVSVSGSRLDVTSDMVLTDGVVQLEEECSDGLASKTSISENVKQETYGKGNSGINLERNVVPSTSEHASVTSEKTEDITSETGLADKIVEFKENSNKLALNMVIDDLSPKAESAKDIDASTDAFQMPTDASQGMESATYDSNEVYEKKEKENESVYVLSVPGDIPIVENAELEFEGFKDYSTVKLPQTEALASEEIIRNKEDEVKDSVSQEKSDTLPSNQPDEDNKPDASCIHVAEDSYKLGGNNEAIIKEELLDGKAYVLQLNKESDALGSSVDADTTENETCQKICSLEEKQPIRVSESDALGSFVDADTTENETCHKVPSLEEKQPVRISNDLLQTGSSGSMINVLPNVNPMVSQSDIEARKLNNVVGSNDMGIPESDGTGVFDIAGGDDTRRFDDENYVKNTVTSNESKNDSSLSQANLASNLLEIDNSASEYISTPHQSPVVTEEGNNECLRTLPETEGPHLNRVSNSLEDIKESQTSRDNKAQGLCAGEDLMASAIDKSGGNEFERTSQDQLKKELIHSPSYTEPSGQNSVAVDDSHSTESGVNASGISVVSLQGEADNCYIKPQPDKTLGDVSKSSSQTDSLEGQWGSVSVLSTQSDNLAVIDTENLPSAGSHPFLEAAEKANIKKPNAASGEQHFDKPDKFEPPSFMTLVEHGGSDQKAAASSEIQNSQQPGAAPPIQSSWFPSLTHAVNESQGRKKNEEIIAKVTNWNPKQHTPLKSLLAEANSETKPASPISEENPAAVVIPREEKVAKDNGAMVTKVSSILGPETPATDEPTNMEAVKEWDSPGSYPADIKREKRKVKGRPLWVQFVCCSSVN